MTNFGVQQTIADPGYIVHHLHDTQRKRQTFPRERERDLVGLEENVEELVRNLVGNDDTEVVSITGMGGIGKSTLARHVFNHKEVQRHFLGLAWVCVSQEFTTISVWQTILRNLKPTEEKDRIMKMTEGELQDELYDLLKTSKALIVLDDIWNERDWVLIKKIFPEGKEMKVDKEMEEMGRQMIKHCGGLPLAIKVLGGLLAEKYTLDDWRRVAKDIGDRIVGKTTFDDENEGPLNQIFSLSFEELPVSMKHCFLYLAQFPEDHDIHIFELSYQWATEGFLPLTDSSTATNVALDYIEELVRRNMVIVEDQPTSKLAESCRLHDILRQVCLLKVLEENFLQLSGPCTSRRFVLQHPTRLEVEREINNSKLRSLVVVGYPKTWMLSAGLCFKGLQLLRRLDLSGAEFEGNKLPSSIGNLILLKYLNLRGAKVSHLPKSLRHLKLLMYLNIGLGREPIFVPNVLSEMQDLRYLELPIEMHKKTKLELSKLIKLETLVGFSTANCNIGDLHGMARLMILTISFTKKTSRETLSASIHGLENLELFSITDDEISWSDGMIDVLELDIGLDFLNLKVLELDMYMPRFRTEQPFSSSLTSLALSSCWLEKDPMLILEKLLNLKELFLCQYAFRGKKMVCSANGFPQLLRLHLGGLPNLEELKVEKGSMLFLATLSFRDCKKLVEFPSGLQFIASLKHLTCEYMVNGWRVSLSEGGSQYHKVKHIPFVTLYDDHSGDE